MALKKKKNVKKTVKKTVKKKIKKTIKKIVKKKSSPKNRIIKKKPILKKTAPKKEGNLIGLVTHYFPHVRAAVIKLKSQLSIGETVKIKGHTSDFTQKVSSIQINRVDISRAKKGDEIGLQVISQVRQGDKVYKI